jgi:hypothetical protein
LQHLSEHGAITLSLGSAFHHFRNLLPATMAKTRETGLRKASRRGLTSFGGDV